MSASRLGVALLLGGLLGWAVASGLPWPIALATAALALVLGVAVQARLEDHGPAWTDHSALVGSGWDEAHVELARARRYERPMTLVRYPGIGSGSEREPASDTPGRAAAALAPHLRRTDRVWVADGDLFLLLPEADRPAGARFLDRLGEEVPLDGFGEPALAAFPRDGLTSGALIAALYGMPVPVVAGPSREPASGLDRAAQPLPPDVIEIAPHLTPDAMVEDRRASTI